MIPLLAFRNIIYRPWRSVLLLFFGYGVGVAVMIVLLSVGEALLSQAKDERLVGGGAITVLPQGLDVEVMKTGGVGGLFFLDRSQPFHLSPASRLTSSLSTRIGGGAADRGRLVLPGQSNGRNGRCARAGKSRRPTRRFMRRCSSQPGKWVDDDGDRRWIAPTPLELRHEIDHFHLPPDSIGERGELGGVALLQRSLAGQKAMGLHLVHRRG